MSTITSQQLITELDKVITDYINNSKKNHKKITRDEIIEALTNKLKEMIDNADTKERLWVASGIAAGMAVVLMIEEKIKS